MTDERRQRARLALTLPVRVSGFGADGQPWTEMSTVKDASAGGAAFTLKHPVVRGHVLRLLLPLPKRFRSYDENEASYHVYALVRSANPEPQGMRIGVMFLGKNPPRGFDREASGIYLLPQDPAPARSKERRQHPRLEMFVNVKVKRLDGRGDGAPEERTITENISRGGARVLTTLPVGKGDMVLLQELDGDFRTRAEIRNVFVGPDNVSRLNLQFLDAQAPDRLVAGA